MDLKLTMSIFFTFILFTAVPSIEARTKTMERDTNDDGRIDQIATFDGSGKLLQLAVVEMSTEK